MDTSLLEEEILDEGGEFVDGIYIPPPTKAVSSFDPQGPRIVITKIQNSFFKSYGQKVILGPFHKCFNAIIGPNGSGKSNVIDSMLFVFGYRSTKLRCKKLSVLIHESERYQNVQSATVAVHFALIIDKDRDQYEIVPNSEFVVARTVTKDNTSYYTLNDSRVQFKEVAILLRNHGIDLDHNRFLILQGEVEQISLMKCKADNPNESGMLEYIEDIIGTSKYIKPLEQIEERIDVLTDDRNDKLNRLKLVENAMDQLKEPMQEAVEYLKEENKIVQCQNIIYQKRIFDLTRDLECLEADIGVIKNAKQELDNQMKTINVTKDETITKLKKELVKHEALTEKKNQMADALNNANKKNTELQAETGTIEKRREKIAKQLNDEKKKLKKYQKDPERTANEIAELLEKEKKLEEDKERLQDEKAKLLEVVKEVTVPLQEKKKELELLLAPLNDKVNQTKSALDLAEHDLKIYTSNEEKRKATIESLTATYQQNEVLIKEKQAYISKIHPKIPLTEKSLGKAIEEIKSIQNDVANIRHEVHRIKCKVEESKAQASATTSRNKVLNTLMKEKEKGNCPGLYGRLGDLGAIDAKYDVAISTACGPLDNLVVEDVETAHWCLNFLKQHQIGRATFIALEKQQHWERYINQPIKTPENVPRLFDLIKVPDERVKVAFYYSLRDTLVAKDLAQASRVAYGDVRYRVVTLNGDLIEVSGTMSGGGNRVAKGRMGQTVAVRNIDQSEMKKMEKEMETFETCFQEKKRCEVTLQNQINTLEMELTQIKTDYKKISRELESLTLTQQQLQSKIEVLDENNKVDKNYESKVRELTKVINVRKKDYDKALQDAQKLQSKVDVLTNEIKAKSYDKLSVIDNSISKLKKTIDGVKSSINSLKVEQKSATSNEKKCVEKIADLEKQIVNGTNRLDVINNEKAKIAGDIEKMDGFVEKVKEELSEVQDVIKGLEKEMKDLVKTLNKLKSEDVDLDLRMKNVVGKENQVQSELRSFNVKRSELKLQEIPEEAMAELQTFTKEEIEEKNMKIIELELQASIKKVKASKPDLSVLEEYKKQRQLFLVRAQQFQEVSENRAKMKDIYSKLRDQRKTEFMTGYSIIRKKLKETYQMITLGGAADLELVDTFDPFTEGLQFNVRPPKKPWKKISNLSGGEKTLSSLALVFALHYYKPSPLYVMDEIDAALDFKNVSIIGHYIKERTSNAQFIIISLRNQMFELCDHLIGIFKISNCTKTVSADPRPFANVELTVETHEEVHEPPPQAVEEIEQNLNQSEDYGTNGTEEEPMDQDEEEHEAMEVV